MVSFKLKDDKNHYLSDKKLNAGVSMDRVFHKSCNERLTKDPVYKLRLFIVTKHLINKLGHLIHKMYYIPMPGLCKSSW